MMQVVIVLHALQEDTVSEELHMNQATVLLDITVPLLHLFLIAKQTHVQLELSWPITMPQLQVNV